MQGADGKRLVLAKVTIIDGPNAGKSTTTNANGEYRIEGLTAGNGNVGADATGYIEGRAGLFIDGAATLNFTLALPPKESPSLSFTTAREKLRGAGYAEWEFEVKLANGTTQSYQWDFGDGSSNGDGASTQAHVYATRGTYTVTVRTRPDDASPVSVSTTITVEF